MNNHLFSKSKIYFVLSMLFFAFCFQLHAETLTATIGTGGSPNAIAVNPATGKVYVANFNSGSVTIIDGATNTTNTITVGANPYSIAVNPVTNKIYVPHASGISIIDGPTNSVTTLSAASGLRAVAVNSVTNKIYLANFNIN